MTATYTDRFTGILTADAIKSPVRVATTGPVDLFGLDVIDGVQTVAGDRVLVKDQVDERINGIYSAQVGAWVRTVDFDGARDVVGGTQVFVTSGAVNANSEWKVDGSGIFAPEFDAITFSRVTIPEQFGADLIGFIPAGTGAIATTVQTELRNLVFQTDYDTYAHTKAAAANLFPLFASPQTNSGIAGAKTRPGLVAGHMAIGDTDAINIDPDAFVGLFADEHYSGDVQQEMRGVSYTIRYDRSTVDEPVFGWDVIPLLGATVVTSANTNDILGNMKAVVGELIFQKPASGSRIIRNAYNLQATTLVEQNITVTNWYGCVIGVPGYTGASGGTITNAFGLFIDNIAGGGLTLTNSAAIRIGGAGNAGRIWWGNSTWVSGDSGGKLELSANSAAISLLNVLTSATASVGGGAAVPATVGGFLSVIIGGVERKIPYFAV